MLKRVMTWLAHRVHFIVDGSTRRGVKRMAVPRWVLLLSLTAFVLFLGVAGYSIAARVNIEVDRQELAQLRKENKLLNRQYGQLSTQIDSVNTLLTLLGRHDVQLRVQANMEILPEDVRELGVGGSKEADPELLSLRKIRSARYKDVDEISKTVDALLRKTKQQSQSFAEIEEKLKSDKHLRDHTPSILPCNGWLCSGFGYRIDPFTKRPRMHNGIDISKAPGEPILATADGVVVHTGFNSGYGLTVKIDHGNEIETFYAHLSAIYVKPGQQVERGQVIGAMGATGRTTGTHLHYEVRIGGRPVNPINYIIDESALGD